MKPLYVSFQGLWQTHSIENEGVGCGWVGSFLLTKAFFYFYKHFFKPSDTIISIVCFVLSISGNVILRNLNFSGGGGSGTP